MAHINHISLLPAISLSATLGYSARAQQLYEMQFTGYIQDPKIERMIMDNYWELFPEPFPHSKSHQFASRIEIFVASDVVKDGKFALPPEVQMSAEYLATLMSITLPDEGCQVRRRNFLNGNFVVTLIDGSEIPQMATLELCLLGAALVALGENIQGQKVQEAEAL